MINGLALNVQRLVELVLANRFLMRDLLIETTTVMTPIIMVTSDILVHPPTPVVQEQVIVQIPDPHNLHHVHQFLDPQVKTEDQHQITEDQHQIADQQIVEDQHQIVEDQHQINITSQQLMDIQPMAAIIIMDIMDMAMVVTAPTVILTIMA